MGVIAIRQYTDDRGLKISVNPVKVIVHPNDEFRVQRILNSKGRVGTDFNDMNVMGATGTFSGGYAINNYLTDTDAWFIKTDVLNGMTHLNRQSASVDQSNDFSTKNLLVSGVMRFVGGWTDPKGMYGSSGG